MSETDAIGSMTLVRVHSNVLSHSTLSQSTQWVADTLESPLEHVHLCSRHFLVAACSFKPERWKYSLGLRGIEKEMLACPSQPA